MPLLPREPHVDIQDGHNGYVSIRIQHYGQVPDLKLEFSPEVLRQAVNKWRRTTREHQILTAARQLSPTAFRIVEAHLIRERALKVEQKLAIRTWRASWAQRRADAQQEREADAMREERAEFRPQRDVSRPEAPVAKARAEVDRSVSRIAGRDEVPDRTPIAHETLTQRANRELAEAKAKAPKVSRAERKEMQRALTEREESLRDLVEFTPQPERQLTLTERARQEAGVPRAEPKARVERSKERTR